MFQKSRIGALALASCLVLAGCAASTADKSASDNGEEAINDPIEPVNRFIFAVNDGVDTLVLNPVATIYREGMPTPVQTGVRNALRNIKGPVHIVAALLAGEGEAAMQETGRFIINTTVGIAGLIDVAGDQGMPTTNQDFGRSLGKQGIGEGPYLVLPLVGPSNLRDAVGFGGELAVDPFNYVMRNTGNSDWVYARTGAVVVSERAANDDVIRTLKADAVDYYARTRSAYTQHRRAVVATPEPQPAAKQSAAAPVAQQASIPLVNDTNSDQPTRKSAPQRDLYTGRVQYRSPDDRP